jgi:hypothetical protein
MILKKKKEFRYLKNDLMHCLEHFWRKDYNPTPKDLKNFLRINNIDLLKKTLRHLRMAKYLDGAYDEKDTFRIYPFKVSSSETSKNSIIFADQFENVR